MTTARPTRKGSARDPEFILGNWRVTLANNSTKPKAALGRLEQEVLRRVPNILLGGRVDPKEAFRIDRLRPSKVNQSPENCFGGS